MYSSAQTCENISKYTNIYFATLNIVVRYMYIYIIINVLAGVKPPARFYVIK